MSETPLESPPEDVAAQRADVRPDEVTFEDWTPAAEADPADALEQRAEVLLDDDEWS